MADSTEAGKFYVPLLEPNEEATHLKVCVFHQKGGRNYFTGEIDQGGIHVSVGPVRIKDGMVSVTLFSGIKALIEPMDRLNRKRLSAAYDKVKAEFEARSGLVWKLIDGQLAKLKTSVVDQVDEA